MKPINVLHAKYAYFMTIILPGSDGRVLVVYPNSDTCYIETLYLDTIGM